MLSNFETTTHGKWILAGEHAVIRGHGALVFPITEKKLSLSYQSSPTDLTAHYDGDSGADMHVLFWSVLEQGMHLLGKSINSLRGHFSIYSNIPIGVGMGASAALCVAVARWFSAMSFIPKPETHDFAKELEHLFHGQSSGLDIAGVDSTTGIYFQKGKISPLTPSWKPLWFLSSCGQIGITSHCIQQVHALWATDRVQAHALDEKMASCTKIAQNALEHKTPTSQSSLATAINQATDCFQAWGLISDNLQQHMDYLKQAGALAVKPTGSGGGGYVISLWDKAPSDLSTELIVI